MIRPQACQVTKTRRAVHCAENVVDERPIRSYDHTQYFCLLYCLENCPHIFNAGEFSSSAIFAHKNYSPTGNLITTRYLDLCQFLVHSTRYLTKRNTKSQNSSSTILVVKR
jgi:hypothetical protein